MLAKFGFQVPDHPEVEEVDPVLPPHQIAGVRVSVEESIRDVDLPRRAFERRCPSTTAEKQKKPSP
jgi:hypothetical protein